MKTRYNFKPIDTGDYVVPDNSKIQAIKSSTDRIPLHPASVESTGDQIGTINENI